MHGSACQTCEKTSITFTFLSTFFDHVRAEVIYASVRKRRGWSHSVFIQVSHFLFSDRGTVTTTAITTCNYVTNSSICSCDPVRLPQFSKCMATACMFEAFVQVLDNQVPNVTLARKDDGVLRFF